MPRLLLADDHEIVREGVMRIVLENWPLATFDDAPTSREVLELVSAIDFDIVILEISLRGRSGFDIVREIRRIRRVPILMLSLHVEERYARRALKAGAAGYMTKGGSRSEIMAAINKVASGEKYVSSLVGQRLADIAADDSPTPVLSDREYEVMCLLGSGNTVGETAAMLAISDKTISTYRARILSKLGMKTNAEITRYVIGHNLSR